MHGHEEGGGACEVGEMQSGQEGKERVIINYTILSVSRKPLLSNQKKKAIKFENFPHYTVYGVFNKPGLLLLSLDNRRSQLYDREPSF